MKRKDDDEVLIFLSKLSLGGNLTVEERKKFTSIVLKQFTESRLRKFCNDNYVLIVFGLLLAASALVTLATGYDGNRILLYMSSGSILALNTLTVRCSMKKLQLWLEKMIDDDIGNIEEVK